MKQSIRYLYGKYLIFRIHFMGEELPTCYCGRIDTIQLADKTGNSSINISRDENLNRLFDSFCRRLDHRDTPTCIPFPGMGGCVGGWAAGQSLSGLYLGNCKVQEVNTW